MLCAADVPRSRLVKYPLLLNQVVKYLWLMDPDLDPQHCQHWLIDPNLYAVCGRRAPVAAGEVPAAPQAGGQVPLTNGSRSGSRSPNTASTDWLILI